MVEVEAAAFVLIAAAAAVAVAAARRHGWALQRYARQLGYHVDPESGRATGRHEGVEVALYARATIEHRKTTNWTSCRAEFRAHLPEGLTISDDDLVPKCFPSAGAAAQTWWSWPGLEATVLSVFGSAGPNVRIFDGGLEVSRRRKPASIEDTRLLVRRAVDAVRKIETAMQWHPQTNGGTAPQWTRPVARPPWPPDESVNESRDSETSALIASLQAGGRRESSGHFTLDAAAAKEKLLKSTVQHPERFGLEVVQAAVLRGATKIEIEVDSDLSIRFDGRAFERSELESLYRDAFADGLDDLGRSRRALAMGLTAALQLRPSEVEIRSGGPAARVCLRAKPDEPDELSDDDDGEYETSFVVDARLFGGSWRAEAKARLQHDCMFANLAVLIDGLDVAGGMHIRSSSEPFSAPAMAEVSFAAEDIQGRAAFVPGWQRSDITFVVDGVAVAFESLENYPPGYQVVVASPRFKRDLTRTQIVRDTAHEMALALARESLEAALHQLAIDAETHGWHDENLVALQPAIRAGLALANEPADVLGNGRWAPLGAAPVWHHGNGESTSLQRLVQGGDTVWVGTNPQREQAKTVRIDWSVDPDARRTLARLLGERLRVAPTK